MDTPDLPEPIVRTSHDAQSRGSFLSVVLVPHVADEIVEQELSNLERQLKVACPAHEIVLVLVQGGEAKAVWSRALVAQHPNLQVIGLLNPVGDEVAYTAGLDVALGDAVITARLGTDPPEAVLRCADLLREGAPVVLGVDQAQIAMRRRRSALRFVRAAASRSMGLDVGSVSLGLRGYNRAALDAWSGRRDRDRVLRLLPALSGYPYTVMPYTARASGEARAVTSIRQIVRSLFYASSRPLRAAVSLALVASALNVLYAIYVVAVGVVRGAVEGWTSLSLQMSLMFFLLSLVIAIMAEFMYQATEVANDRPAYRVAFESTSPVLSAREALNVEAAAAAVQQEDRQSGHGAAGLL